jgi:hypothetical protein
VWRRGRFAGVVLVIADGLMFSIASKVHVNHSIHLEGMPENVAFVLVVPLCSDWSQVNSATTPGVGSCGFIVVGIGGERQRGDWPADRREQAACRNVRARTEDRELGGNGTR